MMDKGHLSNATKHLRISFHEVKEKIDDGSISVDHLPGVDNPSDLLTKPLPRDDHERHTNTFLCDKDFIVENAKLAFELTELCMIGI